MKKHIFVLLVPLLFMAAGCEKDPNILKKSGDAVFSGKVLETDSDVPIPNAYVELIKIGYTGDFWVPNTRTVIQNTRTDAQGNYRFFSVRWEIPDGFEARAVALKDKYSDSSKEAFFSPERDQNTQNIYITPWAWLKIHVKNVNPVGREDAFRSSYGIFVGANVDTTVITKTYGSKTLVRYIGMSIIKNGIETSKTIPIITPPHDTTALDIFY
jgi:hypothetical protein